MPFIYYPVAKREFSYIQSHSFYLTLMKRTRRI